VFSLRPPTIGNQKNAIPTNITAKAEWFGSMLRKYINGKAPINIEAKIYPSRDQRS